MKRRTLETLLSIWNRATNPRALRTAHEHARNRTLARIARTHIGALGFVEGRDYAMSDHGGMLYRIRVDLPEYVSTETAYGRTVKHPFAIKVY